MKTEFDEWFADTFDERDIDDESLYSIAKKAWDEAMNRGAGHGKECATNAKVQNGHIAQQPQAKTGEGISLRQFI